MVISEYIINVIASVIAIAYMDHAFEKKYDGWKRWLCFVMGCSVYWLVVTEMNRLINFEGLLCIFYGVVLTIYGALALKGSLCDKICLSLMWILITLLGTFSVYGVLGFLLEESMQDVLEVNGTTFIYAALAASGVKFLMGRIVVRFYEKKEGPQKAEDWMIEGTLVLILLMGLGMFQLEFGNMVGKERYVLMTCLLLGQFGGMLLLENIYGKIVEYQKEKMEQKFHEEQEEIRKENMMDIYRIGREINHWRHDMNAKLEVLYLLQKKGRYQEVERTIEKVCEELKQYPELPQETGNEGLNMAFMKAITKCRDGNIRFSYVVMGKPDQIDSIDMGNLMWNLCSNGIEACLKTEKERMMEVVVRQVDRKTEIRIENSVPESILRNNPEFKSGKNNEERHGFGMETIYATIRKYQGEYVCWEEDGHFIQELYFIHE